MKKILRLAGHFLVICSLVFFFIRLMHNFGQFPSIKWSASMILIFIACVLLSASTVAITSIAWTVLLRGGEISLSFRKSFIIIGYSQIAKYLPGNVFHYLGRVSVGSRFGISLEPIALSMGVETFLALLVPLLLSAIGLLTNPGALRTISVKVPSSGDTILIFLVAFALLSGTLALFFPMFRQWVIPRLTYLRITRISTASFLYLLIYAVFGVLMALTVRIVWGIETDLRWYHFSCIFAFAWILGFIIPGAPAGLGIRETVLVGLLSHSLGEGAAVGISLTLRLITSFGDILAFGTASLLRRIEAHKGIKSWT